MLLKSSDKNKFIRQRLALGYLPSFFIEKVVERAKDDLAKQGFNSNKNVYQAAISKQYVEESIALLKRIKKEESSAYRDVYSESIENTIKQARAGDKKAILRLIEWDKRFLFESWVKNRIIAADAIDNRRFIDDLADAIKSRRNKSKTTHPEIYQLFKYYKVMGVNLDDPKIVNYLRDSMLNA